MLLRCVRLFLLVTSVTLCYGKLHNPFSDAINLYDLPTSEVLPDYVRSLEEVTDFAHKHKNVVDINFMFGIFVVHVNLKFILERELYIARLDPSYDTLRDIAMITQDILDWFWNQVDQYEKQFGPTDDLRVTLTRLFAEDEKWMDELRNFNVHEIGRVMMNRKAFVKRFPSFDEYLQKIGNVSDTVPSPALSDFCLSQLVSSKTKNHGIYKQCLVPEDCLEMVQHGTNYGYSLTHRLFFLLFARYTRRCKIFSDTEDKSIVQKLCSIAYNEGLYITKNNYGIMDLLMEQMTICTLHGYSEFLNRKMLARVLEHQTPYGCFAESLPLKPMTENIEDDSQWEVSKSSNHTILGGACNGHTTSVASASISLAVRFILETAHSH